MIELITGPMRSEKSTLLLSKARRLHIGKQSYIVVRPKIDTRPFFARNEGSLDELKIVSLEKLTSLENPLQYSNILIDEFQFFEEGVADFVCWLSLNGVKVYVASLNSDSDQKGWPETDKLFHHADKIKSLSAVCSCCGSEAATYTYYDGVKTEKILVGTKKGEYLSLCRQCLSKRKREK